MQAPPSPNTTQAPSRMLYNGWNEYQTEDNRKFFYNLETREKSWKPPRRRYNSNVSKLEEFLKHIQVDLILEVNSRRSHNSPRSSYF